MRQMAAAVIGAAMLFSCAGAGEAPTADAGKPAPKAEAGKAKAKRADPILAQVEDVPGLPRALLIGDSISMGYTLPVRELLKGKANVHRPQANCSSTVVGLENLDKWLGERKWDVIHFNWGLHDLKYVDDKNNLADAAAGKQCVPLPEYEKNLRQLVERLKKTGAKLIWCATTPVPEGAAGRVPGDEVKYNQAAARVMAEAGVEINDLHAFAAPKLKDIQQPKNVHFTADGSKQLAQVVAERIAKALGK